MKKLVKKFLLNTKAGKLFMRSLAVLNTAEGIIHLIVALIGVWGVIALGDSNIGVWTPIIENFIFGIFSILTGWALGMTHHHHHNEENEGGDTK